jgi:hypothetical protein
VEIANLVMQECGVDVIATICPLGDDVAVQTAAFFARNLLRFGDFRQAYEASKPGGNRTYVYLNHYGGVMGNTPGSPVMGWAGAGQATSPGLSSLTGNDRLLAMVERTQTDVGKLVTDVEVLKTRLFALEEDLAEIRRRFQVPGPTTWQSYMIVLIGIGVFAVLTLILVLGGVR